MKVLIIGSESGTRSVLADIVLKEKYGNDVEIFTPEQAKEKGLKMRDFINIPEIKITAPLALPSMIVGNFQKWKRKKRRERRRKNRKSRL